MPGSGTIIIRTRKSCASPPTCCFTIRSSRGITTVIVIVIFVVTVIIVAPGCPSIRCAAANHGDSHGVGTATACRGRQVHEYFRI
jgi:hypothetical protein